MKDLTVTLIQSDLHWENPVANLAMFEEKIWKIGQATDIIVLPEMFSTGFTMNATSVAEVMNFNTFKWMRQMADHTGALMLGSIIAKEDGKYFNRLLWMEPGGNFNKYDKRHLFRMAEEHKVFSQGSNRFIGHWRGWNICPLVCYDLRFPVWSRNQWFRDANSMSYDALIYVANWPQSRVNAWDTLLRARSIENLCYTVGVNRVGNDGNKVSYNGHSAVIDSRGDVIFSGGETEFIQTITLDGQALKTHREKFPAYLDSDNFKIE